MLAALERDRRATRARRSRPRAGRRRGAALRGRELRPGARPRRPPPHPRPRPGLLRVRPGPAPRRRDRLLRRASRLRRPPRRRAEARRRARRAAVARAGRRRQARRRRRARPRRRPRPRERGRRPRLRPRRRCARCSPEPASSDVRIRGEELLANIYGWVLRSLESTRRARARSPSAGATSPSAATWRSQRVDMALLEPRLPPRALLQPGLLGAEARVGVRYSSSASSSRRHRNTSTVPLIPFRCLRPARE